MRISNRQGSRIFASAALLVASWGFLGLSAVDAPAAPTAPHTTSARSTVTGPLRSISGYSPHCQERIAERAIPQADIDEVILGAENPAWNTQEESWRHHYGAYPFDVVLNDFGFCVTVIYLR